MAYNFLPFCPPHVFTHRGWVTQLCIRKNIPSLVQIACSPVLCKCIPSFCSAPLFFWTHLPLIQHRLIAIWARRNKFQRLNKNTKFSFKKMHLKMSAILSRGRRLKGQISRRPCDTNTLLSLCIVACKLCCVSCRGDMECAIVALLSVTPFTKLI